VYDCLCRGAVISPGPNDVFSGGIVSVLVSISGLEVA